MVPIFLTRDQAAHLLGISHVELEALLESGELSRCPEGVLSEELAQLMLEREQG